MEARRRSNKSDTLNFFESLRALITGTLTLGLTDQEFKNNIQQIFYFNNLILLWIMLDWVSEGGWPQRGTWKHAKNRQTVVPCLLLWLRHVWKAGNEGYIQEKRTLLLRLG